MSTPRSVTALFALLLVLVAGCGGSSDSGSARGGSPSVDEMVELLPKDSTNAVTLDVDGVREQTDNARLQPMVESTVVAFPGRDHAPLYRALDAPQVTGMVRTNEPEMLLIGTTQKWADARKAFEREGWVEEAQGVLTHPEPRATEMLQYVTGRDGLIVLSGNGAAAIAARDGKSQASPELRDLIGSVDGVARGAKLSEYECRRGVAIGHNPAADDGVFVMSLDRDAIADSAQQSQLVPTEDYTFEQPRAEGAKLVVPFRKRNTGDAFGQPAPDALSEGPIYDYDCGAS